MFLPQCRLFLTPRIHHISNLVGSTFRICPGPAGFCTDHPPPPAPQMFSPGVLLGFYPHSFQSITLYVVLSNDSPVCYISICLHGTAHCGIYYFFLCHLFPSLEYSTMKGVISVFLYLARHRGGTQYIFCWTNKWTQRIRSLRG